MSSFSNASKQSVATMSNQAQNTGTIYPYVKAGAGLPYNSPAEYNDDVDPISGNALMYNSVGTEATWSNVSKT